MLTILDAIRELKIDFCPLYFQQECLAKIIKKEKQKEENRVNQQNIYSKCSSFLAKLELWVYGRN